MKRFLLMAAMLVVGVSSALASDKYTVEVVLRKESADYQTMAIDEYGSYHKVSYVLEPTKVDEGSYNVTLTRKDANLYQVDGTSLYIRTKFCYEYVYSGKAVLVLHRGSRYSYGEVIFLK